MRRAALFSFYRPQATDARRVSDLAVGLNQFDMTDAEGLGQFIECDDGRVPPTALKATKILLAEARARLDLLLGQTAVSTQAREIPAADSDEAAPSFREDRAPLFRDDVAPSGTGPFRH
jgi:hypothetical protein